MVGALSWFQIDVIIIGDVSLIAAGDAVCAFFEDVRDVNLESGDNKVRFGDGEGQNELFETVSGVIRALDGDGLTWRGYDCSTGAILGSGWGSAGCSWGYVELVAGSGQVDKVVAADAGVEGVGALISIFDWSDDGD